MPKRKGVEKFDLNPHSFYYMYYGTAILIVALVFIIGLILNQCQGHVPKKVGLYYFEQPAFLRGSLPVEPLPLPWAPTGLDSQRLV